MSEAVFTFDTTHMALWAEEVARDGGIPVEVIPAPPEAEALCDLALATLPNRAPGLASLLEAAGVGFYPPSGFTPDASTR